MSSLDMLILFACHATERMVDTAMPVSDERPLDPSPVVEGPSGSFPALQTPFDGESVAEGPVEFKILSDFPASISVYRLEDLSEPFIVVDALPSQDGVATWVWSDPEPWQTYAWQAENEMGTSVTWQFSNLGPNQAPDIPELVSPMENESVLSSDLAFTLDGGEDPDGDPVLFTIELFKDGHPHTLSPQLDVHDLPWMPKLNVETVTSLCWTAWAVDDKDVHGPSAEPICFELYPD